MRILYHHRTQAEDGQAVHIRALIEAFRAEGHEVRESALVPRAGPRADGSRANGAAGRPRWSFVDAVPRFVRELGEYGYSVPARRRLARDARAFGPDFLYERYAFGNAGGVRAAEQLGLPLVLEVNSPMVLELSRTRGLSFPRFAERLERSIFRRATRVAVVTGVLRDMLVAMGVERERLLVTPNGVHLEAFEQPDRAAARADLGLEAHEDGGGLVFGFVGYYRDWHRLDLALEALAGPGLEAAQLVLVGAGPAEKALRARAGELGVARRVRFAGPRPHARIPALLAAFDVGLVPAINPYASPLKLHEYMAAGLAVLAPDQPNLREVLAHEENALLLAPGDGAALAEAMARLARDPELRARLGAAARRTVRERDLTWRGNARRVVEAVGAIR